MLDLTAYAGLFAVSFLAATILPAQSEFGLAGLILGGEQSTTMLVLVASVGNTLGSVVNWFLGRGLESFRHKKWFPASAKQLDRATNWYRKFGRWSLLLSWAPIVGDPLTLAAGILREPLWSFFLLVAIAKTGRYITVAAITLGAF